MLLNFSDRTGTGTGTGTLTLAHQVNWLNIAFLVQFEHRKGVDAQQVGVGGCICISVGCNVSIQRSYFCGTYETSISSSLVSGGGISMKEVPEKTKRQKEE